MKLAWLTDIHLEFADVAEVNRLWREVSQSGADAVLISGDICNSSRLQTELERLENCVPQPVYYVLGNHDYYGSSIEKVRTHVEALSKISKRAHWLVETEVVPLTARTALIGHDSWADGRLGDYAHSDVMLNDYYMIQELSSLTPEERLARLNDLGDKAAAYFERVLPGALEKFQMVVLVMHVPPFEGACWYAGKISDANYLPHFACKAVGEVLAKIMLARPQRELLVLCGHTHGAGQAQILPNLIVKTGGAEYTKPKIQEMISVE